MKLLLQILLLLGLSLNGVAQFVTIENKVFKTNDCPIYFNGANTPWDNWNDFGGSYDPAFWATHFATLKANGINSSRVWISCNGDVQPGINTDGTVTGVSQQFWENCDHYFQQAQANGIYIMATMMSFDHTKNTYQKYNSWRAMLNDPTKVQTFIDNYLVPFVNRYKTNPYLMSIDLCSEIEWIAEDANNMRCSYAVLQRFTAMCAAAVHNNSSVLFTLGSASPKWNAPKMPDGSTNADGNKWSDQALKAQFNDAQAYLDFYSFHYYAWMYPYYKSPFDVTIVQYGVDDKAVVIGETPGAGPGSPAISVTESFENLKANGYQGHYPWTSNGIDNSGSLSNFGQAALDFKNKYAALVSPSCSPTGVNSELETAMTYTLAPNPFSDALALTINTPSTIKISLKVIDAKGEVVFSSDRHHTNEKILLGQKLPPGIFMVQIHHEAGMKSLKIEKY